VSLIWKLIKYRALAGIAYRFVQRKRLERRGTAVAPH
jgi:hypothetical protein